MRVYDFDNTIYDGESFVDLYWFMLKKNPRLAGVLPKMIYLLVKYKLCCIAESELIDNAEKYAKKYFFDDTSLEKEVIRFWDRNQDKIKNFYLSQKSEDDVILSAGFDFQLTEICRRLGIKNVISSVFNTKTGKIERLCFGKNKLKYFMESFPEAVIDEFYTDSMNDKAMFEISKRVFIVKGNEVKEYKNEV